ncbi:MAG TPA: GNAT family N-acetyltransferase [Acidimicrobiales bacterium]|nr:GNAT family N-acetyltransferase [Acidimicrobiales bacterium]
MSAPTLPKGYEGRVIQDIRSVDDEFLELLHAFKVKVKSESRPGEPAAPLSELTNDIRRMPSELENSTYAVIDAPTGALIGYGSGNVERTGDNEHLFWLDLDVLVQHRRRGIGRWLLHQLATAAHAAGAELLSSATTSVVEAGEKFATSMEADSKQVNRESELDLTALDWGMVEQWVREGPSRAPGYALELYEGNYPETHYDDVIAWWDIMNTAPKDDLSWNDDHLTRERLAEWEAQFALSGVDRWEYIARHVASAQCVGVTNAWLTDWNPAVINQGDTGVHPDHRGHALGKWLKATMLQKIRAERPQARVVRTDNAFSNDAMLGINNALGFRESRAITMWELRVDKALKLLA